MQDPVLCPEGHSFERTAIIQWLTTSKTSPVTRTALTESQLVTNRALKEHCDLVRAQSTTTADASSAATLDKHRATLLPVSVRTTVVEQPHDRSMLLHISVQPSTELAHRTPVDVVLVIDISGSMGTIASIQAQDGSYENDGLTLLDVVKHAARTVIATLGPGDRLALVSYSSSATCLMGMTVMDKQGQLLAKQHLDSLRAGGTTNLWDGLHQGMTGLASDTQPGRPQHVMLLTDGIPNIVPNRGHLAMLQKYRKGLTNGRLPTIHTFGFGYSLDSDLLNALATEGGGMYSFVPDAGFVGTAFVNSISNILSTCGEHAMLNVELDGTEWTFDATLSTSRSVQVPLGLLTHGQGRDIVLKLAAGTSTADDVPPPKYRATLQYLALNESTEQTSEEAVAASTTETVALHSYRQHLVTFARSVLSASEASLRQSLVASFEQTLARAVKASPDNAYLAALHEDTRGQIAQAVSREDWWNKWGIHYLRSLVRAHEMQFCSNFKDPGLQHYGGRLFRDLREDVDDLFNKLPPPTPAQTGQLYRSMGYNGGATTTAAPVAPVDMSRYNSSSGPCFDGRGLVQCADGTCMRVDALTMGTRVWTPEGPGVVRCVLKTRSTRGFSLTTLPGSGLRVTPYHPVMDPTTRDDDVTAQWTFPHDVAGATTAHDGKCSAVYSFLVERPHIPGRWATAMRIDGVTVVTLAHGMDGDVVGHPFYGTDAVVRDLTNAIGWTRGRVVLDASHTSAVVRDLCTNLVCGLRTVPAVPFPHSARL